MPPTPDLTQNILAAWRTNHQPVCSPLGSLSLVRRTSALVVGVLVLAGARAHPQGVPSAPADSFSYRTVAGRSLQLFRFPATAGPVGAPANAILLFHGGGWSAGAPEWTFAAAREFASWGLVALPVQYRLATGSVTPLDALQDVCAAFAWVRTHQAQLGVTGRLAGYGVSAGGHLVAATSTVGCLNGDQGPEVLLLLSPALDLARDQWFAKLLLGRGTAQSLSPVEHVRPSTAPTSIVQGAADVLTPLEGARRYCARLTEYRQPCQLHGYPRLGHLLTRNLKDQETVFDPDPVARADGMARHRAFLQQLGFLPNRR